MNRINGYESNYLSRASVNLLRCIAEHHGISVSETSNSLDLNGIDGQLTYPNGLNVNYQAKTTQQPLNSRGHIQSKLSKKDREKIERMLHPIVFVAAWMSKPMDSAYLTEASHVIAHFSLRWSLVHPNAGIKVVEFPPDRLLNAKTILEIPNMVHTSFKGGDPVVN